MDPLRALSRDFFATLDVDRGLDAAVLLRRNGRPLAAWARNPVSWDVVTAMAATTLGSLETLAESLGMGSPQTILIVTAGHRIYLEKVESQAALVLIAQESVEEAALRRIAARLLAGMPSPASAEPGRRVTLGPNVRSDSRGPA